MNPHVLQCAPKTHCIIATCSVSHFLFPISYFHFLFPISHSWFNPCMQRSSIRVWGAKVRVRNMRTHIGMQLRARTGARYGRARNCIPMCVRILTFAQNSKLPWTLRYAWPAEPKLLRAVLAVAPQTRILLRCSGSLPLLRSTVYLWTARGRPE